MNTVQRVRILDRDAAIRGLMQMHQEWEETGTDLVETIASIDAWPGDEASLIGMTPEEPRRALGDKLCSKLSK